jgi:hypothetical protein
MQSIGFFDVLKQQFAQSFQATGEPQTSSTPTPRPPSSPSFSSHHKPSVPSTSSPSSPSFSKFPPPASPSSPEKRYSHLDEITSCLNHVCITLPGPMYLRLRMDENLEIAKLTGFEKGPNGQISEVEKDKRVKLGDVLIAVNFTALYKRSFDDIIVIIKNQPEPSIQTPKILTFCSKSKFIEFMSEVPLQLSMALSMEKKKPQANLSTYHGYVKSFHETVQDGGVIDEMELRKFAMMGLPDGSLGIRSMIWKLLLG